MCFCSQGGYYCFHRSFPTPIRRQKKKKATANVCVTLRFFQNAVSPTEIDFLSFFFLFRTEIIDSVTHLKKLAL